MTAATRLAVFYATESKILRRKVVPDDDAQLERLVVPSGESVLWMPLDLPHDDRACRAAIAAVTGVVPSSGRCCVVDDDGVVIAVCNADPALDIHPRGRLIASDNAQPGDRFLSGRFVSRFTTATNSATTDVATVSGTLSK
jgi:hypothetical protein